MPSVAVGTSYKFALSVSRDGAIPSAQNQGVVDQTLPQAGSIA